ncbi:MAG TPA: hypothetical protein VMN60_05165 [Longimicrobiales bacterium]|nr:hypothetical protein [Longimicrobiales bacterium]
MRVATLLLLAATLPPASCVRSPSTREDVAAQAMVMDTTIIVRRLAAGTDLTPLAVFPDGERIVVVDTTGDIAVQDLRTGRRTRLTSDANWSESHQPGNDAAVSRDGNWIAYTFYTGERGQDYQYETRVLRADGSATRTLHRVSDRCCYSYVNDWTPAGDALLVSVVGPNGAVRLVRLSVADGALTTVLDAGWREPRGARYSPDGRALAYALHSEARDSRDVYVLDLATGQSRKVVDVPETAAFVGWAGDQSALYYSTTAGELTDLWRLPLRELAPDGPPQLVRADLPGMDALTLSDGRLFYTTGERQAVIRHVVLDATSSEPVAPPVTLVGPYDGWVDALSWSPDAMELAYTPRTGWPNADRIVAIHSRATGQQRSFAPSIELMYKFDWRTGGLYARGRKDGQAGIFRMDVTTGEFVDVPELTALNAFFLPGESHDGRIRTFVRDNPRRLIAQDVTTGAERVILTRDVIGTLRSSPDGRWVAILSAPPQTSIDVVSTSGGEPREIYRATGGNWISGGTMGWTPDSRHVVVLMMNRDEQAKEIWRVSLAGEAKRIIRTGDERSAYFITLSADGRHLAFAGLLPPVRGTELWVMEHLPDSAR